MNYPELLVVRTDGRDGIEAERRLAHLATARRARPSRAATLLRAAVDRYRRARQRGGALGQQEGDRLADLRGPDPA
jgi:hypothetical protein